MIGTMSSWGPMTKPTLPKPAFRKALAQGHQHDPV